MRKKQDRVIVFEFRGNSFHLAAHYRANGLTGGEKIIGNIDLSFHNFLVNLFSILVRKFKIRNNMVNRIFYCGIRFWPEIRQCTEGNGVFPSRKPEYNKGNWHKCKQ